MSIKATFERYVGDVGQNVHHEIVMQFWKLWKGFSIHCEIHHKGGLKGMVVLSLRYIDFNLDAVARGRTCIGTITCTWSSQPWETRRKCQRWVDVALSRVPWLCAIHTIQYLYRNSNYVLQVHTVTTTLYVIVHKHILLQVLRVPGSKNCGEVDRVLMGWCGMWCWGMWVTSVTSDIWHEKTRTSWGLSWIYKHIFMCEII